MGSGLYKSEDDGNTWTKIFGDSDSYKYFSGLAFSPTYNEDSTIFVGSRGMLYKSNNRGESWEDIWIGNCSVDILVIGVCTG